MKTSPLLVVILVLGSTVANHKSDYLDLNIFCPKETTKIMRETLHVQQLPSNITYLDVCNAITSISPDAFEQFKDLESLNLDGNEHMAFPSDGSPLLRHDMIAQLSCARCGISVIYQGSLSSMPSLEFVNLTGNAISQISSKAFRKNLKLHNIDLSRNNLSHVSPDMVDGLKLLKNLDLSYNKRLAPKGNVSFLISTSLEELNCDDCGFSVISFKTFAMTINLQKLYLRRNEITFIESKAFDLHKNLSTLQVQNNQLKVIDYSLLVQPMKLCLEGNSIILDCDEKFSLDLLKFQCSTASPKGITCAIKTTTTEKVTETSPLQRSTVSDIIPETRAMTIVAPQLTSSTSNPPKMQADTVAGISNAYITGYLVIICLAQLTLMMLLLGVYLKMAKNDADPKIDCYAENIVNPTAFYKAIR
ncbi:toll-like receptor 3 [Wyeomyia smithii]|uniref:toll-like receptor 3 n=1 Tax=Wyeomyia smithii TaxID=174621 RepID=UPI002467B164|nr:toll-like receptor 3 [Wyeomyia smithii]